MRTTRSIDPDVTGAAQQIAAAKSESLGAVISELAQKGLKTNGLTITARNGFPIVDVPAGSASISLEDVKRAENENDEYYAGRFA